MEALNSQGVHEEPFPAQGHGLSMGCMSVAGKVRGRRKQSNRSNTNFTQDAVFQPHESVSICTSLKGCGLWRGAWPVEGLEDWNLEVLDSCGTPSKNGWAPSLLCWYFY